MVEILWSLWNNWSDGKKDYTLAELNQMWTDLSTNRKRIQDLEQADKQENNFTKINLDINWESKEIYLANENLKIDSTNWEKLKIKWINVKINPEWDITEYLEWEFAGQQLFSWSAAMREANKLWFRLPTIEEFRSIVKEIWIKEFVRVTPGSRNQVWDKFSYMWKISYFWSSSNWAFSWRNMEFSWENDKAYSSWSNKTFGFSVRLVKD
jgi:hypothetical protein